MNDILVTGATGSIGSALVPKLLQQEDTRIWLLLRAPDAAAAQSRLVGMLNYWGLHPGGTSASRLHLLHGDIAVPGFGLPSSTLDMLARECSRIIHCAASVKLNMPLEQARAATVVPTLSLLALARRGAELGRLSKVDLISTVGVWGRTPGRMPERRLPEIASFHNTYEAAKSEAERRVWEEGAGLPITVHRPSMVVGERRSGRAIQFQVFYHLCEFLSGLRTFGIVPDLGGKALDVVPVDWVADIIVWANRRPETAGAIYHLCSGPDGALPLCRLQQQVRAVWRQRGYQLPRLKPVPKGLLRAVIPLIGTVAGAKARRALRALPPILEYLSEDQAFDNVHSARTFEKIGLPVPMVSDYLAPVLDYYLAHRPAGAGS